MAGITDLVFPEGPPRWAYSSLRISVTAVSTLEISLRSAQDAQAALDHLASKNFERQLEAVREVLQRMVKEEG